MRKFLIPLIVGELCVGDSCFCMTKVGTYSFMPYAKTFSTLKSKIKISRNTRKWAKKALIASAVIGGGVIAYRAAPAVKSQIKALAIRLGIIKPPVDKSRWEKFRDYLKQYASLPVFFSISGVFALILGANRVSNTYTPIIEDTCGYDGEWEDVDYIEQTSSVISRKTDQHPYLHKNDSNQTLVNPRNSYENKMSINSFTNNLDRAEYIFDIIDEIFKELPKKSAQDLELANRVINMQIKKIEGEPLLKEDLLKHFGKLKEAKNTYDSLIKKVSPQEKQEFRSKNVNEIIDTLKEGNDFRDYLTASSKFLTLHKNIIKMERSQEKEIEDLTRILKNGMLLIKKK